jgi:TetR/AcrR family transcriptional regulator
MPQQGQASSRERLLRAAAEEFSEQGYAGARTARIAARARVNKQLIHYYFGSKLALYEAVLREATASLPQDVEPAESSTSAGPARHPAERIRASMRSTFGSFARTPRLRGLLLAALGHPAREDGLREKVHQLIDELATHVSRGQGLGYFRDDVDPGLAARQAVVLALGYLILETTLQAGPATTGRAEWVEQASDLVVRSLSW